MGEVSSKRENSGDRQAGRASGRPFRHSLKRNPASSNEPTLLVNYYRTVSRYRRIIVGTAFLGFASGVLLHLTTLPVYQARTSVDVQSLNGDFMNMRSVAPTNDGTGTSTDAEVQTQIKLMQSDTLMEHTAARMDKEPHPESVERKDLFSRWTRALHLSRTKPLPYQELIAFTAQNVKVKPLGLTRLFEVTCDSWDPDFSAKFCNTLIKEFQEEDLQGRATEAQKTRDWLTKQAEDVRIKADDLQKQLQASVGGDGLILSQDSNSVGEDRLREIQGELVKAKADRMEKEAQMAISNSSPVDTVPGVVNRPGYQTYQQKLTDLRTQVAQLVPPLTEENPKVIHLRSQIREMEAGLDRERIADTATMKNEYDAARHREALLAATYQATEANVSRDLGRAAQVSMLRREGEAEQQLYTTLQQRAKEAGFASAMQASTLHIVDVARTPASPISPRRGSAAVFGMVLGSMIGVGFAFFKDRNFEVLRMPGDSERFLNIQELGVIPAANIRDDGMRSMLRRPPKRTATLRSPFFSQRSLWRVRVHTSSRAQTPVMGRQASPVTLASR
jgi:succinoglycan biosynthesis transport protein ExoP